MPNSRASLFLTTMVLMSATALFACSEPSRSEWTATGRPITGGSPDTDPAHMATVALTDGPGSGYFCSGTLITDSVVLTAAHCLEDFWGNPVDPTSIEVFFGNDAYAAGTYRGVSEGEQSPDWNRQTMLGDAALLRLSTTAPAGVTPIPYLPVAEALTQADEGVTSVDFSGFGFTEFNSDGEKLHVSDVIDLVCDTAGGCDGGSVVQYGFSYDQDPGGPCSGDSGGPAYVVRNNIEYVAGITSYGDPGCSQYGVSTIADRYAGWIDTFINSGGAEDCTNTVDDDGDGLADCDDPDCAQHPTCLGPSACALAATIACGETLSGDTADGVYNFIDYVCGQPVTESGPEVAFLVDVPEGTQITADLMVGSGGDLDLFLLPSTVGDCDQGTCLDVSGNPDSNPEQLSFTVPAGGVYLVVETWDNATTYSLSITCNGMVEDCTNGTDDDGDGQADCDDTDCAQHPNCLPSSACTLAAMLSCGEQVSDDTANGVSVFSAYSCLVSDTEDGPELAYLIDATTGTEVTLDLVPGGTGDLDIFVLGTVDGMCDPGDCLHKSTFIGNDTPEQIVFTMPADPVYLVVETFDTTSTYDLDMSCSGLVEDCGNQVDDDGDGQTDCDDPDCANDPLCQPPVEDCGNQVDDDGDGQTDCDDPDCANDPLCQPPVEDCGNQVDDDGDGQTDCDDPDCANDPLCQPPAEVCDNQIDDDQDGQTDCDDTDCANDPACQPPAEVCDNQIDDDQDGQTDCDDTDCANDPACQPPAEVCDNQIDDDQDGQTDCDDTDCANDPACQPPAEDCGNQVDDDLDGQTDCDDTDCANDPACQPPAEDCDNQIDDDLDGQTDCDDTDCANDPACQPPAEDCDNQIDDDLDGQTDCDDTDCANDPACQPPAEDCDNQIDDDLDGQTDCDDTDCANDPACQPPAEVCDNQVDDDQDGQTDCDDTDCANDPACQPPAEVCDNQVDDDQDGQTDCDDTDCADHASCTCPDADSDGHQAESCGGDDCDDADAAIYPGADDVCEDGIDQDCSGDDLACTDDTDSGSGCGCTQTGMTGRAGAIGLLGLLGCLTLRRRRASPQGV